MFHPNTKTVLVLPLLALGCSGLLALGARSATLDFQLLTWNDSDTTTELPSAVGRKPSAALPATGDWLVFTADDDLGAAANNPAGALSHNLVAILGTGGSGFNLSPSLAGALTLQLEAAGTSNWSVTVSALAYAGQANAMLAMNQFLVTPGSPGTTNPVFNVDGVGNSGSWNSHPAGNWALQYTLDFYFAASADGDPSPADIDATFNDKPQTGFLIPVNQLTSSGLAAVDLDAPLGFFAGDFERYLLDEIKPRLPANATYLLITQMAKIHPDYTAPGLPITVAALIGNTTIAYTTQTLAPAPRLLSLQFVNGQPVLRFTASAGQSYAIQRSSNLTDWETIANPALTFPEATVAEWIDPAPASEQQFYQVLAVTP